MRKILFICLCIIGFVVSNPSLSYAQLKDGGVKIDYECTKEYVVVNESTGTKLAITYRPPTETEIKEYNTKVICSESVRTYESNIKRPAGQNYTIVTPDSVIQKIIQATIKDIDSKVITMPTEIIK